MGKKSRRARARAGAKQRAGGKLAKSMPAERVYSAEPKIEPKAVPSVEPAISSAQATRYQYILPELRLIGIISGVLFIILIALAFMLG
ncbi:MAG: hypothetical protein H8E40_01495 [Chloroflexi bacterium]|nr:hypothetical protein [Chloroflexota bacterium]MBL7061555.1 hypothetical protein [Dehalococcoidia bacterium]